MRDRRVAYGRGLGILEHALNFFGTRKMEILFPWESFGFGENQSKCVILNSLLNVFFSHLSFIWDQPAKIRQHSWKERHRITLSFQV